MTDSENKSNSGDSTKVARSRDSSVERKLKVIVHVSHTGFDCIHHEIEPFRLCMVFINIFELCNDCLPLIRARNSIE